ncbi:MAG: hypothetical protein KY434_09990 [Actinobacteria bacterium]|nr:hypothetical protein [Actinomycetota bacterium]
MAQAFAQAVPAPTSGLRIAWSAGHTPPSLATAAPATVPVARVAPPPPPLTPPALATQAAAAAPPQVPAARDHARVPVADLTAGRSALDVPAFEDPDATPVLIGALGVTPGTDGVDGSPWAGEEEDERHLVLRVAGAIVFVGGLLIAAYVLAVTL